MSSIFPSTRSGTLSLSLSHVRLQFEDPPTTAIDGCVETGLDKSTPFFSIIITAAVNLASAVVLFRPRLGLNGKTCKRGRQAGMNGVKTTFVCQCHLPRVR